MNEQMKKPQMKDETRKKVDNFWYYYKFHVLIGAFLLFMAVVFIKDMLSKVDYDYNIAFVTDYMIADEDSQALQSYFEANAEDLNGDGEVHVQIQNYVLPAEDAQGYDPQMLAAGQTKMTVDLQEGTSMIFFISEQNYEKFKDADVFPEKLEDFTKMEDCAAYAEMGSPSSVKDLYVAMRSLEGTKMEKDEEMLSYYDACETLLNKFVSGGK